MANLEFKYPPLPGKSSPAHLQGWVSYDGKHSLFLDYSMDILMNFMILKHNILLYIKF